MNSYKIFTRKTMGLDNRVWRLMITLIVLSMGLLSYRLLNQENCVPFSITIRSLALHENNVYYTGETLSFAASSSAKQISWDFDDTRKDIGPLVYHQFLKEGIYLIKASTNSVCDVEKEISITRPPVVKRIDSSVTVGKIFSSNSSFYTYTDQKFTYLGSADSYTWSVLNQPDLGTKSGPTVSYTFPYAGTYYIQVEVLLDSVLRKSEPFKVVVSDEVKPGRRTGRVTQDYPPPPGPKLIQTDTIAVNTPPKTKIISSEQFLDYLRDVQNKVRGTSDFEQYGILKSTQVVVNGNENDPKSFEWLCNEVMKKKKKGIPPFKKTVGVNLTSARLVHINGNGPVSVIYINYDYE